MPLFSGVSPHKSRCIATLLCICCNSITTSTAVGYGCSQGRFLRRAARDWPGHGKFIVTTYLSTNKESQLAARIVPFLGSLMQGVSAILFVFILAVGFNLASGDLSTSRWYVEKISAVLIGAFGAFVIYQALKSLRPRKMTINAISPCTSTMNIVAAATTA
jgi:hypothetical protein